MAYHVEARHEKVGEAWPMCRHVFGMLPPLILHTERKGSNACNRVWSSQLSPRSARTGNTKATPKTNCTSGAWACRPFGTLPKSRALLSCNACRSCERWSAMFVQRCSQRGWDPRRRSLSWTGATGLRSNGIMRSRDFGGVSGLEGRRLGGRCIRNSSNGPDRSINLGT